MCTKRSFGCAGSLILAALVSSASADSASAGDESDGIAFFESTVRPLLAQHCFRCHGAEKQESDLRLDTYEGLFNGGAAGDAVVSGEPSQSMIIIALRYLEEDLQMPPDGKLNDGQIAGIVDWIDRGPRIPMRHG